jgi:nitroreductase
MGTLGYAHNIPCIVVVIGTLRAFFSERDRHLIYTDASLATMSFVFAAETLGLSSCCINWPDIRTKEAEMAQLIGLAPDERVVLLIAVGYPDASALVPRSEKKPVQELRSYNRF